VWAIWLIGIFYLFSLVLGYGASALVTGGAQRISTAPGGTNSAAPLLAYELGGEIMLGIISAIAFATILAVVAGLTLSGAATLSHDLWVNVVRHGQSNSREELLVARAATVALALVAITLGILFKGQNVAYMVGLAFAIAASANFPVLVLSIFWSRLTTAGAQASTFVGTCSALGLIWLSPAIQIDVLKNDVAWFPLRNPGVVTIPLAFAVAIVVSLLRPVPEEAAKFRALERRLHLGAD
jgi:cation/acetate symporter